MSVVQCTLPKTQSPSAVISIYMQLSLWNYHGKHIHNINSLLVIVVLSVHLHFHNESYLMREASCPNIAFSYIASIQYLVYLANLEPP